MQITLGLTDVNEALLDYIVKQGINVEGKEVEFKLIAGRKGNGLKVEVNILSSSAKAATEAPEEVIEEAEVEEVPVEEEVQTEAVEPSEESTPNSLFV